TAAPARRPPRRASPAGYARRAAAPREREPPRSGHRRRERENESEKRSASRTHDTRAGIWWLPSTRRFLRSRAMRRGQIASNGTGIYSVATMGRPKRGEILSLTIDDLAYGGEGVGRADGYVVFVPGGLPGDRLQVRLVQARSRFGRGVIDAVLE